MFSFHARLISPVCRGHWEKWAGSGAWVCNARSKTCKRRGQWHRVPNLAWCTATKISSQSNFPRERDLTIDVSHAFVSWKFSSESPGPARKPSAWTGSRSVWIGKRVPVWIKRAGRPESFLPQGIPLASETRARAVESWKLCLLFMVFGIRFWNCKQLCMWIRRFGSSWVYSNTQVWE